MPTLVLQGVAANPLPVKAGNAAVLRRIYTITGITRGSSGTALPYCFAHAIRTSDDRGVDKQQSNSAGSYSVSVYDTSTYYVVGNTGYTADSTILTADSTVTTADTSEYEGTTINTLVGV